MSIYKTNTNLPDATRIEQINNMIVELNGKVSQGKFDINEITQIYSDLTLDREFKRNILLGNTLTTYGDWSHVKAEDGYSIWKLTPNDYTYNAENDVYFDNNVLENRGEADSELATAFDFVYLYDAEGSGGGAYIDDTAEASTEEGTEFEAMDTTADYLYLGEASTFAAAKFEWHTRGSNYTLKVEYYNGVWTELTENLNSLDDDTSGFESDGRISWVIPGDWAQNSVNGETKYWIRLSTTSTPVTVAKCYYLIPGDSVIAKLALSSTQIQEEDWAWCTYGTTVYVTIRNTGNAAYEGNYYITTSSTTANKQNFFIYNHQYKSDYQDSTYVSGGGAGVAGYYQAPVLSKTETAPPSGYADGDRYLVLTGDSGEWFGHDNEIAEWYDLDSSWHFTTPLQGMITWVKDEDVFFVYYNAQWNELSTGGGGGVSWQAAVTSKDIADAPGIPSDGDRYVVASGTTSGDAWYGETDNIAEYDTGVGWIFVTAVEGMALYVDDINEFYMFDGVNWEHWGQVIDFISDADGDTKVETERTSDDDTIYLVAGGVDQVVIPPSGVATFTQFSITPSSAPTTDYQVANKKYVDDQVASEDLWDYTSSGEITPSGSGNINVRITGELIGADATLDDVWMDSLQIGSGATINSISIDGTLVGNSDTVVPTEQAVKTYVDAQITAEDFWDRDSTGYVYPNTDGDAIRVISGANYLEITENDIDCDGLFSFYGGSYFFPNTIGATGQVLTVQSGGTTLDWEDAGSGGSTSLAGLSDVSIPTPSDGQVLTYNGSGAVWVAEDGGGTTASSYTTSFVDADLDSVNILVVNHSLGASYPHVVIYDNNEELVLASVEYIDTNTVHIDFDPVAPISGTWNVRVSVGAGGGGGGTGTPGGSDTQMQYNNSGAFGGASGITYNDSTNVVTIGGYSFPSTPGSVGEVLALQSGDSLDWASVNITDTTYFTTFDDSDIGSTGLLTVNHNLGTGYPNIIIYDDLNEQIVPDANTNIDVNTITCDLSSFGTLTGTWKIRVSVGAGAGSGASTDPGGTNTQIQFNDSGIFGGDADLTWNNSTNVLTVNGDISVDNITATGNLGVVDVTATGDVKGDDLEASSTGGVYIGDQSTNDSWRMTIDSGNLVVQKRETGVWVTKGTFVA